MRGTVSLRVTALIIMTAALAMTAGAANAQLFAGANGVLMSPESAAGVNGQTLFRHESIVAALPGLRITGSTVLEDGRQRSVFLASDGGEVILRIYGGADGRVSFAEGISPQVYGPSRIRVGMEFARVPESQRAWCARGEDRWAGAVFCGAGEQATLWLVFQPPAGAVQGEGAAMPPDALAQARLVQIRWTATSGMGG